MVINQNTARRLGVFVFYDKDGIVDDYVLYLLSSLKEATEDLIIVSNCDLKEEEKAKLLSYTSKLKIRKNIGLDAGAFKSVFDEYQRYIKTFDELLLVNDTFYGPFTPIKTICEEMEKKDIDFWGLTANYDSPDGFGYLPDHIIHSHIQTFFIAFRSTVLNSEAFIKYWQNYKVKKMRSFNNVVTKHEIVFTHYLEQAGFKWDTYTNLEKYHSKDLEENYNTYAYAAYDLIKNCHCPIIKRKNFVFEKKDALFLSNGEDNKKCLDYIEKNHLYDTKMIWKNLIRLYNSEELYYGMNLNYIIEKQENKLKKYAIVFVLEEEKFLDFYISIFKNTALKSIFIFTKNKNIKSRLERENISVTLRKDFEPQDFDYIAVLKDQYLKTQKVPLVYETNLKSTLLNGMENQTYINGVIQTFEENPFLGELVLPQSLHGDYFGDITKKENGISANFNCCWIRSQLFDWDAIVQKDFVQAFIKKSQNHQMVVGKIYNPKGIQNTILNQEYILQKTYQIIGNCNGYLNHFPGLLYNLKHTKRIMLPGRGLLIRIYRWFMKIKYKFF